MSQQTMAQVLGCSLPAYQKWELGLSVPGGDWLLKMLQLCPDEETRNAFRIRKERRSAPRQTSLGSDLSLPFTREERLHCRDLARQAIDTIYHCGEQGNPAADARLRDFAANLQAAAAYYEQVRKDRGAR
jgi:transcriptional regulator with XRE-family HTH domain